MTTCLVLALIEHGFDQAGDNVKQYSVGDGIHSNAFGHLRVASVFSWIIADTYWPNHTNDKSC